MPFNPNLPYSQVHGASGPAVFEQGGVFYERDGTEVPAPTDESVFHVMGKTNPLTGRVRSFLSGVDSFYPERILTQRNLPFVMFFGDGGSFGLSFNGGGGGAFTLSSAVATGFVIPAGYCYLPANSGGSGNSAGWFYFTMASATTGVIYGNAYDVASQAVPVIPNSTSVFPGSPSGRITQTTSEVTCTQVTLPGGSMGKNGKLAFNYRMSGSASAGTKSALVKCVSTTLHSLGVTTTPDIEVIAYVKNTGTEDAQVATRANMSAGTQSTYTAGLLKTINFGIDQTISWTMVISSISSDSIVLWPGSLSVTYGD